MDSKDASAEEDGRIIAHICADVMQSMKDYAADGSAYRRRTAIRTIFCAIEGLVWHAKNCAAEFAKNHPDRFGRLYVSALEERIPSVSSSGAVTERSAFLSLPVSIRLVRRTFAATPSGKYDVETPDEWWKCLLPGIEVRNRLVHPKGALDVLVSDEDVRNAFMAYTFAVIFALNANGKFAESIGHDPALGIPTAARGSNGGG